MRIEESVVLFSGSTVRWVSPVLQAEHAFVLLVHSELDGRVGHDARHSRCVPSPQKPETLVVYCRTQEPPQVTHIVWSVGYCIQMGVKNINNRSMVFGPETMKKIKYSLL